MLCQRNHVAITASGRFRIAINAATIMITATATIGKIAAPRVEDATSPRALKHRDRDHASESTPTGLSRHVATATLASGCQSSMTSRV